MSYSPDPGVHLWERWLLWMFWWCPVIPLLGYDLWLTLTEGGTE